MRAPAAPPRRRAGPLLFLPGRWQRPALLATLKRVHAWTGLWGATLFLLLGVSGFLLNHRAVLPIDTGAPVVSRVDLPIEPGAIGSEEALGRWARKRLHLHADPKPLVGGPAVGSGIRTVRFLDREVASAPMWGRTFHLPDAKVSVTHAPGSAVVTATREAVGALGVLKNLHKGTGLGAAWVLLLDTIAGALVTMSVTGFLLWSRLHGPRLLAGALAGGAVVWAAAGAVPFLS